MSIIIRNVHLNDAADLGFIHAKSWQTAYKNIIPHSVLANITIKSRQYYFKNAIKNKSETSIILIKNEQKIGFATYGKCRDKDLNNDYGELWGIYLHPDFFYQGFGSILLDHAIQKLKELNFKYISLWVLEENLNARRFYEKNNFIYDGTKLELEFGKKLFKIRYIKKI